MPEISANDRFRAIQRIAQLERAAGPRTTPQTFLGGLTDAATQGLTLGFGDEMGAAVRAGARGVTNMLSGDAPEFGANYDRALADERGRLQEFQTENLASSIGAEVAGGLMTGGTLARGGATLLNAARPTVGAMAARGAAEGAAYGGVHGFGTGEGTGDRLSRAASGAGIGAATGGALGAGAGMVANRAAGRAVPTADDLRVAANEAYDAAESAGMVVAEPSFAAAVDDIAVAAREAGIDRTIHPRATAALGRLMESEGDLSLREIDTLRRVLRGAASSNEPDERRIATLMIERLDDYIGSLTPGDVVAGDPVQAVRALGRGRDLWGRLRRTEIIEEAIERAQNRAASTGSGGNIDNAIRQNIRGILDNPRRRRGFSADELSLMRQVVRGGPVQNLARLVGRLSPEGNGLMAMLHGAGGVATAGATLPLAAVGFGAKRVADAATPRNVEMLLRAVRSGGSIPAGLLTGPQRAALEALIVGGAQQGGEMVNR